MSPADIRLHRDRYGKLVLTEADGTTHHGITPMRAFPIAAPEEGIALVGSDGHELLWLDRLEQLPAEAATLIREELANREFMPEVHAIRAVSSFATPSTWTVDTDRGTATFILKSEDDIRRLPGNGLLISDSNGIQFLIRDRVTLDRHSLRLLGRFM